MPHLKFKDVEGHATVLDLGESEVVIGRQSGCDIVVPRQFVSRRHARIYRKGKLYLLEDLGSSHGTFVNRLRVKEKVLEAGDQILIGDEVIAFAETAVGRAAAKRTETAPKAQTNQGDDTWAETDDYDLSEIVAERLVGAGKLMRTMIGARSVDMAVLGGAQGRSVADLVVPEVPEEEDTAAGKASPDADPNRDSLVASHLLALVRIADELRRCTSIPAVSGAGPALPKGPFEIASVKKRFEPALLIVPVGAVVSFPNRVTLLHNVYSGSDAKKFHLGLYGAGVDKTVTFDQPGIVNAFCNIHPQMAATILVMSNGFFGHPDEKGDVTFTDVPEGTWHAAVWFPFGSGKVFPVPVAVSKPAPPVEVQVIERPDPRRHTREDGTPYGGY